MQLSDSEFEIKIIRAREILDSRGNPTIEVDVVTRGGTSGRAAVPSGASTGIHEAMELRDGDESRYRGKGVLKAIKNVEEVICPALAGKDIRDQKAIDMQMIQLDSTSNKKRLGANAILGVSFAVSRAAARIMKMPLYRYLSKCLDMDRKEFVLPVPFMNIINGGKHAGNDLAIQEFMILPYGAKTFREALRVGAEIYLDLGESLIQKYGKGAKNVGDEGGYAPNMKLTYEPLDAIVHAIERAGYRAGKDVGLALDAAASVFYREGKYTIDAKRFTAEELVDFYCDVVQSYPILSLEDPFQEDDFETFARLTQKIGSQVQIVGDDLFATNPDRIRKGIDLGAANALLLKANQIGTLTEALEAARLSYDSNYSVIVSHRSGETEDPIIADIAVGICSGQIKAGALARSDRTAKYNQLLRIEEELEEKGVYAGRNFRSNI